jgi:hypothetical protein
MNPTAKRALIRMEQQSGCATRRMAAVFDGDVAQVYVGCVRSHIVGRKVGEKYDDFYSRVMREVGPRAIIMTKLEYDEGVAQIERMI